MLTPEDAVQAPQWPDFSPPVLTAEGRRRAEMYAARQRRQAEAAAFGGSREEFLRQAGTQVTIGRAAAADIPRLHELSVRTRQLNSGDAALSQDELAALAASPAHLVATVALRDHYGDDGIVGCAVMTRNGQGTWPVPVLMMSCRALGRGVLRGAARLARPDRGQRGRDRADSSVPGHRPERANAAGAGRGRAARGPRRGQPRRTGGVQPVTGRPAAAGAGLAY